MEADPVRQLRSAMRADLVVAMTYRASDTVAALRVAIAAIDNAEAVAAPTGSSWATSEYVAGAVVGVGGAEMPRRALDIDAVQASLRTLTQELRSIAETYDAHGRTDEAVRAGAQASVIEEYVPR